MSLYSDGTYYYAVKIKNVQPHYWRKPFGQQLTDLKIIKTFQKRAKRDYVLAKGKPTHQSVKLWLKENKPLAYYAKWKKDSPFFKDDSIEIFYERTSNDH